MRNIFIYVLLVFLICSCSSSSESDVISEVTFVPAAPSNLSGVVNSSTQITLSWRDESTNESEFKIERKIGSGAFVIVGSTSKDVTNFIDINLVPNTVYIYRVFSKNANGNSNNHSNELNRSTPETAMTVVIGSQIWSKFNLDVTTYSDGTPIPQVSNPVEWSNLTTGAWCYYNNDPANGVVYGKLYNWYAVHDSRGLAPAGWHIPTDTEWSDLATFLGGEIIAGSKLKEDSTTSTWDVSTNYATNQSGFTAVPAGTGYLNYHLAPPVVPAAPDPTLADLFKGKTKVTYWWSSTTTGSAASDIVWSRNVNSSSNQLVRNGVIKSSALSVRCVKD